MTSGIQTIEVQSTYINAMGMTKAMAEKVVVAKFKVIPQEGLVVCSN